jgi:hypothetical protein
MTDIEQAQSRSVVDPRTGELLDLAAIPHEDLVDIFQAAQNYERKVQTCRRMAEDELVRRAGRDKVVTVGENRLEIDHKWTRKWDPDDLETTLIELRNVGAVTPGDLLGVITSVPKINGNALRDLLNRYGPEVTEELERCFTWEQKGRATVKVTPVAAHDA